MIENDSGASDKKLEKNNELPVRGPPVDWAGSRKQQPHSL